MPKFIIDEYIVRIFGERWNAVAQKAEQDKSARVLYWGDEIDMIDPAENNDLAVANLRVNYYNPGLGIYQEGYVKKRKKSGKYQPLALRTGPGANLLEYTFVDVQQGDGTLIVLPDRRKILVDGGEGKFVARMLAANYPGTTAAAPLEIDTLVITHGDADHFSGLFEIPETQAPGFPANKRLFVKIKNYYHNGLVKAGGSPAAKASFGNVIEKSGKWYASDLWDDPRQALNPSDTFAKWGTVLNLVMDAAGSVKRLKFGDDALFDRFRPVADIRVLGPVEETVNGKKVLRFFKNPEGTKTASHTINGHSVVLRMQYGNVRFLLGGDLNIDASVFLLQNLVSNGATALLESDVFKVPHHGSHEFHAPFFEAAKPVVSIVSSGDESAMKEYVHPRANLMAALGRYARGPEPLVFCTELAAFFAYMGEIRKGALRTNESGQTKPLTNDFYAFNRLVYGLVRLRTDGNRVFVAVESASASVKECYLFRIDAAGQVVMEEKPELL